MLPRAESTLHQIHKLAESQGDPRRADTIPPPPPYSPSTLTCPKEPKAEGAASHEERDQTSLINIHIDASMSIQGNANSIIIPSVVAPAPAPALSPRTSSTPIPSTASTTPMPHSSQHRRHSKLTDMATSIIVALHRTGYFNSRSDGNSGAATDATKSPSPSVTLNINTGIKILGSGNVICVGVSGQRGMGKNVLRRKRRASSEPPETTSASIKRAQ
ncbi:hypothetical protein ASPBRDRAFT_44412 [Aspergillus brasiliensis CBS 101740]|uniref:Uncharacterized protein n=1 Tax=Aspergillus brasiliensis (strain CBS 101740 / IMI 381727 / IBT 21946) TaxID=767769 RepID=A0A1L9UII4_ASPBC|nr:hypothetical protein ASPBRDRAFT_44412 [Aspergillus brasiliensis CBS 101740]